MDSILIINRINRSHYVYERYFADKKLFYCLYDNSMKPLKPLLAKLQKRNQDIFKEYCIIHFIVSDLMDYKRNLDT